MKKETEMRWEALVRMREEKERKTWQWRREREWKKGEKEKG